MTTPNEQRLISFRLSAEQIDAMKRDPGNFVDGLKYFFDQANDLLEKKNTMTGGTIGLGSEEMPAVHLHIRRLKKSELTNAAT